ncbi:SDR family NAD(P)-dependent oxidoreductase [Mangrovihabitans endophyticus]|uniref:Short-chain dehydrogenase/reductase n=1 Tax=Mangrovihabitans endophyticus TaxID=1751298 RepID=A0A8J3BU55_9ACTN|nr:SDR family NAD(P)-dependent oxidoreductase [Mangrovihabitans endophyticus]GGK74815.1 short-chain dehydrogenase/reductase [Mangrovihabitans endophyticus]
MTARPAILITGCSTGVGNAVAWRFLRAGFPVYATARDVAALRDLAAAGAVTLTLDVADEADRVAAVKRVEADHGAVGILVNNAAYGIQGAIEVAPLDRVRQMFETNVFGQARLSQLVLPAMRERGAGRIVNLSAMGGKFSLPGAGYLHASKYAVEAVSDALRREVRGFGITVVVVEPGPIHTAFPGKINATLPPPAGGVYDDFHRSVEQRVAKAYADKAVSFAQSADQVARVVERAALTRRPRARYASGVMARGLMLVARLCPDAVVDLIMRTQFPGPQAVSS